MINLYTRKKKIDELIFRSTEGEHPAEEILGEVYRLIRIQGLLYMLQETFLIYRKQGGLPMDVENLRKAFALIARGLVEKEEILNKEPARYPHSPRLQHGINMFLAVAVERGRVGQQIWTYADESAFLEKYAYLPVEEWFCDWEKEAVEQLHLEEQPFYGFGPLAMWLDDNRYGPSEDCFEYLESLDSDILNGTEERMLYEKMKGLSQEHYTGIREFIIRHPLSSREEIQDMKIQLIGSAEAIDAINFAYEPWEGEAYRCPSCGWTMTEGKYGPVCHSRYCTKTRPLLTEEMKIDRDVNNLRLKKGVMRYFAQPGKLELEIADYCKKFGLSYTLWPMMDTYDIEISFPDGKLWEIDAKAYHNPIALRNKVQNDPAFDREEFERGYYVIPSEFVCNQKNYTRIVDGALKNKKRVKCITSQTLRNKIREKVVQLNEG